jgi:hypothetical protein
MTDNLYEMEPSEYHKKLTAKDRSDFTELAPMPHEHSYIVTEYQWLDGGKRYSPPKPAILRAKTLTCSTCLETKEL